MCNWDAVKEKQPEIQAALLHFTLTTDRVLADLFDEGKLCKEVYIKFMEDLKREMTRPIQMVEALATGQDGMEEVQALQLLRDILEAVVSAPSGPPPVDPRKN